MKIIIVLSFLIAIIYSQTYSYYGNITVTNTVDFSYRFSTLAVQNIANLGVIASYTSTGDTSISGGIIKANVITGGIKFLTGTTPLAYLTYYNETIGLQTPSPSTFNVSVNITGACVTLSPLRIEEWNSTYLFRTVYLKQLAWNSTSSKNGDLSYITANAYNSPPDVSLKSGEKISMVFFCFECSWNGAGEYVASGGYA
jgi:hypothetical protein